MDTSHFYLNPFLQSTLFIKKGDKIFLTGLLKENTDSYLYQLMPVNSERRSLLFNSCPLTLVKYAVGSLRMTRVTTNQPIDYQTVGVVCSIQWLVVTVQIKCQRPSDKLLKKQGTVEISIIFTLETYVRQQPNTNPGLLLVSH